jgi:hypothetical protein
MSTPLYIPDISTDAVITALIAFLQPFVGNWDGTNITPNVPTPIIRGEVNRVPMPGTTPEGPFVKVMEINRRNLDTPSQFQSADPAVQQATITNSKQLEVQIDFYGLAAGEWSAAVESVWRSPYGADQFPAGMAPLYCSDARQLPLVTGEEQYEYRWVITGSLEYNPDVIVPQPSATELSVRTDSSIFEDLQ